jgi:methylated-DNA-protein-cysteine methyltransferase-like protein
VPWQRVINSKGEISVRSRTEGHIVQRHLLEAEGVQFDAAGRVDFEAVGWDGPNPDWLSERKLLPPKPLRKLPPSQDDQEQLQLF